MPLMLSGLVTVALLSFVGAWNNFFLPLVVLSDDHLFPLTLGLNVWNSVSHAAGGGTDRRVDPRTIGAFAVEQL